MHLKIGDYVCIRPDVRKHGLYPQAKWSRYGIIEAIVERESVSRYQTVLVRWIDGASYRLKESDLKLIGSTEADIRMYMLKDLHQF